jgi:DNA-binding SARP family transcriptional activator
MVLLERGRLDEAEQQLTTALELAQQYSDLHAQILIHASLGDVAMARGTLDEASTHYIAAYHLTQQNGYARLATYALVGHVHSTRLHGSRTTLITLLDYLDAAAAQSPLEQAWLNGARAGAYWALSLPGALEAVEEALVVLPEEEHNDRGFLLLLRAQILFEQGQTDAALETWARINELARRIANPHMFTIWARAVPELVAQAVERGDPLALRLQLRIRQTSPAVAPPLTSQAPPAMPPDVEPTTTPAFTIQTLGAERILRDGQPTNGGGPLTRAVFFCLLAAGPQGLPIETLRTRIWGDDDWSGEALKMAIKRIRRDICGVRFDGGIYALQLPANMDYDVQRFLDLLQRPTTSQCLQKAVGLYGGPYLPRLEQPWAVGLRNSLAERYINAQVELATMLLATDAATASQHYQAALQIDPYHASAVVGLMRAYTALGRRFYALDLYHDYTKRINENGLDPDRTVEQVYRQLLDE